MTQSKSKPKLQDCTLLGRRVFSDVTIRQNELPGKLEQLVQRASLVAMLRKVERVAKTGIQWGDFYYVDGELSVRPRPIKRIKTP